MTNPINRGRFKSKVDFWLIAVIVLFTAVPFILIAGHTEAIILGATLSLPLMVFVLYMLFNISYDVDGSHLIVKAPPFFHARYDIQSIESIKPTRSPLSAPAASLDRLEIRFKNGRSVIVSPKSPCDFIARLSAMNPAIVTGE